MNEILIDLSELIANPLLTGIQRVERELLRHWPGPAPLVPCRFDAARDTLVRLPETTIARLLEAGAPIEAAADGGEEPLGPRLADRIIFNPELFFDRARADFYRRLCRAGAPGVSWLVYDFLPWLEPQFFGRFGSSDRMEYIMALREVPRVGFISRETRADYQRAIMRDGSREGPVFALGADGLCLAKQRFDPARRDFVVLGSIEPRKNLSAILEAFQGLWRDGIAARLVLLGRIIGAPEREQAMLASLAAEPNLTFIQEPDETTVRSALSRARALLAASIAEGFGLPPFEALAAGIPVIAPASMPSIRLLEPGGQVRLKGTSAAEVAAAVRLLLDDATAARLFAEAACLTMPTWGDFGREISIWLQEG